MSWSRMLFCSSWAIACSAQAVDLGDGPLTSTGASSPGEIVCESGSDCQGGQCKECFLETCLCDSSDDFRIPACLADGAILAGPPLLSADGTSLQFTICTQQGNCRYYHWSNRFGLQEMPLEPGPTPAPVGISADGRQMLLSELYPNPFVLTDGGPPASVYLYDIEHNTGSVTSTDLLSGWAQLLPSGVVVGLSPSPNGVGYLSRWSAQRGLEVLSDVDGLVPKAATPDGSSIVGQIIGSNATFLWSERGGLVPDLAAAIAPGEALSVRSISADGSTLAGDLGDSSGVYRWTEAGGLNEIAGAPSGADLLLSDDGSVLAGLMPPEKRPSQMFAVGNEPVVFIWRWEIGLVQQSTEGAASQTLFMSGDGAMLVGGLNGWYPTLTLGTSTDTKAPPRRVQPGVVTGYSHDGNVAAGTASCGGVDAVLVREHMREDTSF